MKRKNRKPKSKAVIEIDLHKISGNVLAKKANDDSVSVSSFMREAKQHEKVLKKIKRRNEP